ncbi:MAG TPA: ABC-F family ATP-binding cassette domain-containing protein [Blastocatellia bacterium]|nr:ABC-F family ATP-binding cassette domain-containing protein [Blastocatellia bacterium]
MLFRLAEVAKSYGAQEVLRAVSFQINPGEHVGLVGRNGAGKTTILRLITGAETPDEGVVERMRGLRLGVLAQHVDFRGAETVIDAAMAVFERLHEVEARMRELEHLMTEVTGSELDRVMHEYSDLQHEYEHAGGFTIHAKAEAVLLGLGFTKEDFSKSSANLSGGEKNRLGLARLLLLEPDILLLDEPTNHLDVQAVEWLEEFLAAYKSAYVIISHDRFFLDHTVNRVLELEFGRIDDYRGNYSEYLVQREERREAQAKAYEQQQELIAKTEEFIRRNIAGQKTKQAKSRRKMLEKLERVENVQDLDTASFKLRPVARTGDQVLILDHVAVGFPTRTLARNITLTLRRGERLGIIGGNGTGKTTLLRTILGKLPPLAGEMRWGANVNPGYYDQQLRMIDDDNTVIDELRTIAPSSVTDGELRSFLGRFLFSGDDVFKPVSALSGGEKGRLALAKLIWSGFNVLLLDEPTNHLDIASCEALEDALNDYDGTIITVSHDRYFLDRIATQILFFGADGVEYFDGGYSEFYETHHRALREAAEAARAEEAARKAAELKAKQPQKNSTNKSGSKTKQKQPTVADIENEISVVETEMRELSALMSTDEIGRDHQRLLELSEKYQTLETRLQTLYQTWEAAVSEAGS